MQKWRIKRYNRTKRPWRSRRFLRAAVRRYVGLPVSTSAERKRCLLRSCLCCMTLAELIVIGITDPAIFAEAKHLFDINWSTERSVEQAGFEEEVSPYPSDRTDSGVTIDVKEGKVEFWRTEEKVRREGGESTGP